MEFYQNTIVSGSGASSCYADVTDDTDPIFILRNNVLVNTGDAGIYELVFLYNEKSTVHDHMPIT